MTERANQFSYEELIQHGKGELPGQGDAKLPAPPMLMFDRITNINDDAGEFGKGSVTAELDLNPDLWFYKCHFIGDPVMPGCLGLDALWQMIGFYLSWAGSPGRGRALGGSIKFVGQATNDKKLLTYHVDIKKHMKSPLPFGVATGWVKADGEIIYKAENLRVGLIGLENK